MSDVEQEVILAPSQEDLNILLRSPASSGSKNTSEDRGAMRLDVTDPSSLVTTIRRLSAQIEARVPQSK